MAILKAGILVIGDEILSGRTHDTNSNFIAKKLTESGISLEEIKIIHDQKETIISNIREFNKKYDYIFTTGGIGPTHDDITSESIAEAFNLKYCHHDEAYKILENYYPAGEFNEGRKKMAKMPSEAKLIYNPSSAAPGFMTKNVLSLPGVPSILNSMIENCKPYLIKGLKTYSRTINLFTVESNISKELEAIQLKFKKFVDIGSYPFFRLGKIGVSVVSRSTSMTYLSKVNKDLLRLVKSKKIKLLKL